VKAHPAGLALLLSLTLQAATEGPRLEGGPFLPYRINHATVSREEGLTGRLELLGQRWDGGKVPLFRTEVEGRTQAVDVVFYLDEDIRSLELRAPGAGPAHVELVREEGSDPAEAALRQRMRRFNPPAHLETSGTPPERFSLGGTDLGMAGFQASYALFLLPISRLPLAPLAGFALVAVFAAALGRRGPALRAGAVLAATVLGVYLAAPKPTLYRIVFPAEGPEARMSGVVERRIEERPGARHVVYAAGQEEGGIQAHGGSTELVGLWAPARTGISLEELVPPGARVRFSSPPLATLEHGETRLTAPEFVTGWVLHERR